MNFGIYIHKGNRENKNTVIPTLSEIKGWALDGCPIELSSGDIRRGSDSLFCEPSHFVGYMG